MDEQKHKLMNSFIEMMLLVGVNDKSGLKPPSVHCLRDIFSITYEPKVLSCFYSNVVCNFFPFVQEEISMISTMLDPKLRQKFGQNVSESSNHQKPKSLESDIYLKNFMTDIEAQAQFCFPDGVKLFESKQNENKVHYFVLTSVNGDNSYVTCLTFYRQYQAVMDTDKNVHLQPYHRSSTMSAAESKNLPPDCITVYVPHCCTLISKEPYFTVMKECLSMLISKVESLHKFADQTHEFQMFVRQLSLTPIPPAGSLSVSVCHLGHTITIQPPQHASVPVFDLPLKLVFSCFPFETIINIVTCILTERQVVFVSSSYALLTIVAESFCSFIDPFHWEHPYVPVLSHLSLELLDAPVPFIMGCHMEHVTFVKQIPELVVVNIDAGSLTINDSLYGSPSFTIPPMPQEPVQLLKDVYEKARRSFELIDADSPTRLTYKKEAEFYTHKNHSFNKQMQHAFLELMINLFRNIAVHYKSFNAEKFIEKQPPENVQFYKEVLNATLFNRFLKSLSSGNSAFWSELEMKTRSLSRQIPATGTELSSQEPQTANLGLVCTWTPEIQSVNDTILVPSLNNTAYCHDYLKDCIKICTAKIKEDRDFSQRASITYLRSMYHLASSNHLLAFKDLVHLHRTTTTIIISTQLIREVSTMVPPYSRTEEYYNLLTDYGISQEESTTEYKEPKTSSLDRVSIPKRNIELEEFLKLLNIMEVCHSYTVRRNLFTVLSLVRMQPSVTYRSLTTFVESWEKNQERFSQLPATKSDLVFPEVIVAVSSFILTSSGLGHLVLTNRRLMLMRFGSKKLHMVLRLQTLVSIEKKLKRTGFNWVDGLVLRSTEQKTFSAYLKKECYIWHLMLSEMWVARVYSKEHKDDDAIVVATESVTALMAIYSCRHSLVDINVNIEDVISHLCHYKNLHELGKLKLSETTMEVLQKKVNPSKEGESQAVLHVLYLSKESTTQLWCALGGGIVRVFDAIAWELEAPFVKTRGDVTCLYSPDGCNVWAGCNGIYIISSDSIKNISCLIEHEDIIIAIIQAESKGLVFTASLDGAIHKWDAKTLTSVDKIVLDDICFLKDIKFCNNILWCACKNKLLTVTLSGEVLQRVDIPSDDNLCLGEELLECFYITPSASEIWFGYSNCGKLYILDSNFQVKNTISLKHNPRGVRTMVQVKDMLWIGTKDGMIHVYNLDTYQNVVVLEAHLDAVRCLYVMDDRYVFSGASSNDGKVAVWSVEKLNMTDESQIPNSKISPKKK